MAIQPPSPAGEPTTDGAEIVQFPDLASRSWRFLRGMMRDHFKRLGAAEDVLDESLDVAGEIYAGLHECPPIGTDQEQAVQDVNSWLSALVRGMLAEITEREIELRQAGLRS